MEKHKGVERDWVTGKGVMVLNETERLSFIEKVTSEHEIEEGDIHVSAGRDV